MKSIKNVIRVLLFMSIASCFVQLFGDDSPAAAPKFLFDENPDHSEGKIDSPSPGVETSIEVAGINVIIKGNDQSYPGFSIIPSKGKAWDLSPWGHVKAKITNTGDDKITVNMRIDNEGKWQDNPWNTESVSLKPGESI